MNWYYTVDDQQAGPVNDEEFRNLIASGTIKSETSVWHDGMSDWARYEDLAYAPGSGWEQAAAPSSASATLAAPAIPAAAPAYTGAAHQCVECRGTFQEADMISFGGAWVCATCKPVYVQKLKEGVAPAGVLNYAGFWIRFGAEFLDGIILQIANLCCQMLVGMLLRGSLPEVLKAANGGVALAVGIGYMVFFNGRFGATPGKMALGLKIVRADGSPISYARAFGRYFAKILSAIILLIGFMMAGWDPEKRALHDRICDTRVIRA